MKLTTAQALATVLNINIVPSKLAGGEHMYVWNEIELGSTSTLNTEGAVRTAMEHIGDMSGECNYAIFPMESERSGFYVEMEREMLQQEAMPHMDGKKAWETFTDPRDCINALMVTAREASHAITLPKEFRKNLIRFGCIVVASLQWCDKWIEKLTKLAQDPNLQERIIKVGSLPPPLRRFGK